MSRFLELGYNHIILDLDGTVYIGDNPIGPVITYLNELLKRGVRVTVVTNNTSVSKLRYQLKLATMGLQLDSSDIISPAEVASKYILATYGYGCRAFVVGTPDIVDQLEAETGLVNASEGPAEFVLIGFDKTLTYAKLERACNLVYKGTPYYITNVDPWCPTVNGPIPDTASLATVIQKVTSVEPVAHFGKPGHILADYLRTRINECERVLLVGDRLYTDIALGRCLNVDTLLVFSGETKPTDIIPVSNRPTHVASTLADFLCPT